MQFKLTFAAVLVFFTSQAYAQQQPQPTTAADRLGASLGQCIGVLEKRNDQVFDLQKQLDEAQAKVKELEEKANAK